MGEPTSVRGMPFCSGQGVFYRSDHYNFVKMGIAMAFFTTGPQEDRLQTDAGSVEDGSPRRLKASKNQGWEG
jgi:hypothetical protein